MLDASFSSAAAEGAEVKRYTVLIPATPGVSETMIDSKWRDEAHCRQVLAAWLGRPAAEAAIVRENPETLEGTVSGLLRKQVC